MVKPEVGMYVRTNKGEITKIINTKHYKNETGEYDYFVTDKEIKQSLYSDLLNSNVIKASYNIIDLIEVGDYVNGEKVIKIFNPKFLSLQELPYVITIKNKYENQDIKSIVTKEQFENMKYEVK